MCVLGGSYVGMCTYVGPCAYVWSTEAKVYVGYFPSLFYTLFLFYLFGYFARIYAYQVCIPGVHRGQKKVVDPLKLDWQKVVSCYMDTDNWLSHLSKPHHPQIFEAGIFTEPGAHQPE